jgi:hypothetical protein
MGTSGRVPEKLLNGGDAIVMMPHIFVNDPQVEIRGQNRIQSPSGPNTGTKLDAISWPGGR